MTLSRITFLFLAFACVPFELHAHSFGVVYTLPVPFWLYAWASAATLIVSFLIVGVFASSKSLSSVRVTQEKTFPMQIHGWQLFILKALSVFFLFLCIATGLLGSPNPYGNFNMTFFWIIFILGFAYLTAVIGDLFALINPLRSLADIVTKVFPRFNHGRFRYPDTFAYWPALLLYMGFIWLELFGGTKPHSLSLLLAGYTVFSLFGVWLVGAKAWFRYCEFFSVFLRLIARMAPIEFERTPDQEVSRRFRFRWPLSGLLEPLTSNRKSLSLLMFVLFMLSATAFDGLHEAKVWVYWFWAELYPAYLADYLGSNPLAAYPKLREIYAFWQAGWLTASPFIYLLFYMTGIFLMYCLTRKHAETPSIRILALRFSASLLPIVLVYHITHYYTLIQSQGVKIIALASDPFSFGWNLFGTAKWFQRTIVPDVATVWHVQVALILIGHIAAVYIAHLEALNIYGNRKTAAISQIPMLVLMVAFTVVGLWILSQPLQASL